MEGQAARHGLHSHQFYAIRVRSECVDLVVYINCMKEKCRLWLKDIFSRRNEIIQKNRANDNHFAN